MCSDGYANKNKIGVRSSRAHSVVKQTPSCSSSSSTFLAVVLCNYLPEKKRFLETRKLASRKLLNKDLPKSKANRSLKMILISIEFQRYFSNVLANVVLGTAPTTISTFCPPLKIINVGMLRIPY
jgi:hypothetical protein